MYFHNVIVKNFYLNATLELRRTSVKEIAIKEGVLLIL